jgi:hypothetical protein
MNTSHTRPALLRIAALALACAFGVALAPVVRANDDKVAADKAPLPVTTSFDKVTGGEKGPFVLKVKNTGSETLKLHAKVLLAVAFHADNKARHVGEHKLGAGQEWSIADLAAGDKVVLTAKGHAPLQVEVPSQK